MPIDPEPHDTGTVKVHGDGYAARELTGHLLAQFALRRVPLYRLHKLTCRRGPDILRLAAGERDD